MESKINIATAHTKFASYWKNKTVSWERIVTRLSQPQYTSETFKEYVSAPKSDRDAIKDVGGYVGGYLLKGKRSPRAVMHRQLVTLDIDYADMSFWDLFCLIYGGTAAVLHATHSHSEARPRFRLIMPLDREVLPDEYVAIARKVAETMDIEMFDPTTFETNRLMYWPSVSKDVEYYLKVQSGKFLSADSVLALYADWKDSSEWAYSSKAARKIVSDKDKQEDPREKKNTVGHFCRAYSISEAIEEFISDAYTPASADRYTYTGGSTSGGMIVYDDTFAFSHHGTDPISGQLCNAFDLVRIHKFGGLDEGSNATGAKAPSFKAMQDFVLKLPTIRRQIAREVFSNPNLSYDAADTEERDSDSDSDDTELTDEDLAWTEKLEVNKNGDYLSSGSNLNLIFQNDPQLKGKFAMNAFDRKPYIKESLPWRKVKKPEPLQNVDISGIRNYIDCVYGISASQKVDDAFALELERQKYHPIREYLSGLEWDGEKRVDTLLIEYFGADDSIYTREAIRKMLVAAVARIFNPGVKYDLVLTLVGKQGNFKSTFLKKLGKGWTSDSFNTVSGKESFEQLQGAWLIEIAELSGLRKAEVETIKHFITKQEDTFRPAYGRVPETYLRQCVFFGTTNNTTFLRDQTGNRRFIPVDVNELQVVKDVRKMQEAEVDQIWAEAMHMYRNGEKLYMSAKANDIAMVEQQLHASDDERKGIILEYLNRLLPENWYETDMATRKIWLDSEPELEEGMRRDTVTIAEIWCECLGRSKKDMDRYKTRELNEVMQFLPGWHKAKGPKRFPVYGVQRYYQRRTDEN